MTERKRICRLPEVIAEQRAMECFGMAEGDFELIVRLKGLPVFRTEDACYCDTGALVRAVQELIAESTEFDALIPDGAFWIFNDAYKAMFPVKKPREKARLREIQSAFTAFHGEFSDFAKSVVFDWQRDLCEAKQKRFLMALEKLGWLTETGEKCLAVLKETHPE